MLKRVVGWLLLTVPSVVMTYYMFRRPELTSVMFVMEYWMLYVVLLATAIVGFVLIRGDSNDR